MFKRRKGGSEPEQTTGVDEAVVVDDQGAGTLITSRKPDDLDAFNEQVVAHLGGAE